MCVHWPPRPNDLGGRGFDLKIKLSDPDYLCSRAFLAFWEPLWQNVIKICTTSCYIPRRMPE